MQAMLFWMICTVRSRITVLRLLFIDMLIQPSGKYGRYRLKIGDRQKSFVEPDDQVKRIF